jgi:NAD-dependent deacetylase
LEKTGLFDPFLNMKHIAVLSGAGISAESGLKTFRDSGGLWEQYRIEDVATPEAWAKNPELVRSFYNMRLRQMRAATPNAAHRALVELESKYHVDIITQNVDDLHERAGSSKVLHLHGELSKCRSTDYPDAIFPMPENGLTADDLCPRGTALRPHIVWFGELVPAMDQAAEIIRNADILVIVGTSLNVYPAAGLAYAAVNASRKILIDPDFITSMPGLEVEHIRSKASKGVPELVNALMLENN